MVEAHRLRVGFSLPFRQQAGPGDGGTETVVADLLHQGDVIAKMLIEGGGIRRSHLLVEAVRLDGKPVIPDGRRLTPLQAGALGLGSG
ncbi:hypothetical protein D3C73_1413220 [compost metagenome]